MALFGDLVATVADKELSNLRTQVCQSMVALLLHLKDQCPAVVTVSANLQAFHLGKGTGQPGQATRRAPQITDPLPHTAFFSQPDLWVYQLQHSMVGYRQTVYHLIHGHSLPYRAPLSGVPDTGGEDNSSQLPQQARTELGISLSSTGHCDPRVGAASQTPVQQAAEVLIAVETPGAQSHMGSG